MQHVHYDLDHIEHGLREMFARMPDDGVSDIPEVSAAFRRSVDVHVALSRWFYTEQMAGTPPNVMIKALEVVAVNLILNHLPAFTHETQTFAQTVERFMGHVNGFVLNGIAQAEDAQSSSDGFLVEPTISGRA